MFGLDPVNASCSTSHFMQHQIRTASAVGLGFLLVDQGGGQLLRTPQQAEVQAVLFGHELKRIWVLSVSWAEDFGLLGYQVTKSNDC